MLRFMCPNAHKPAHGHGHCYAHRDPDFFFATEVTPGPFVTCVVYAHKTHIKLPLRNLQSDVALKIQTKIRTHSRGTCQADLAAEPQRVRVAWIRTWFIYCYYSGNVAHHIRDRHPQATGCAVHTTYLREPTAHHTRTKLPGVQTSNLECD